MNKRVKIKKNRASRRKQEKMMLSTIVIIAASIVLAISVWIGIGSKSSLAEELEGLWIYDSVTSYEFDVDGHGMLHVQDRAFNFEYHVNGKTLTIDFEDEIVEDCEYKISFENEMLYMEGGKGTSGGVYELAKKDI